MNKNNSEKIINHPEFIKITREKKRVSFGLLGIVLVLFLAIPVVTGLMPELFKIHLFGGVNLGFSYILFQYVIGGLVAIVYSKKFSKFDVRSKMLMNELIE